MYSPAEGNGRPVEALLECARGVDAPEDARDADRECRQLAVLRRLADDLDRHRGLAHGVVEDLGEGALLGAHPHDEGDCGEREPAPDEDGGGEGPGLRVEDGGGHGAHFPSRRRAASIS